MAESDDLPAIPDYVPADLAVRPGPQGGAPCALTTEVLATMAAAIERGATFDGAANLAGISPRTAYRWLRRGRSATEQDDPYARFCQVIGTATALAEQRAVERVMAGGRGWNGAAWWLERRHRNRWGESRITTEEQERRTGQEWTRVILDILFDPDLALTAEQEEEMRRVAGDRLREVLGRSPFDDAE